MTANRRTSTGSITGANYQTDVDEEVVSLNNRSICKLTITGGTADALQCTVDPPIDGASLVDGMRFEIEPTDANTVSALTIEIVDDGSPPSTIIAATDVVDRDGNAIAAGEWVASRTHILTYDAANDRLKVVTNIEPTPEAAVPQPAFRNILAANGGMEIWQRGAGDSASISATNGIGYTADRWYINTNGNFTDTISAQAGLSDRSRKCARVQRNSGQTQTGIIFAYPLTTEECVRCRGAKISLSFKARGGANLSDTGIQCIVAFGTGSEGKRGAGFTGETTPINTGTTLVADGSTIVTESFTSASAVATNITQGEVLFIWNPTGTAGANDWVELDDVQLEVSDSATAFEYLPFEISLQLCQRHYAKTFPYGTAPAQNAGITGALSSDKDLFDFVSKYNALTTAAGTTGSAPTYSTPAAFGPTAYWRFPARMRTTPTITTYNPSAANANWRQPTGGLLGAAQDTTATVSPDSSTSDSGVTIVGAGATAFANPTATKNLVSYIHAQAAAEL